MGELLCIASNRRYKQTLKMQRNYIPYISEPKLVGRKYYTITTEKWYF